jgi:ABC-type uncharacterized transport system auxiliary subunit
VKINRSALAAIVLLAASVALVDCGSARPMRFYTLQDLPATPQANSAPLPLTIVVGRIGAPLIYRDDRIIYGTGPVEMGAYEYHRWAEPPAEMLENMLTDALRTSGAFRAVERVSSGARGDYIVRGHLIALEEVDTPQIAARFAIELELYQTKTGAVVWTQSYSHDQPVSTKTMSAVVEAMQTNVRAGMQQLSSSLVQYVTTQVQSH